MSAARPWTWLYRESRVRPVHDLDREGSAALDEASSVSSGLATLPIAATLLVYPGPAQTAEIPTRPVLNEVIVTATRRPELLSEVPLSVSVLSNEDFGLLALSSRLGELMRTPS